MNNNLGTKCYELKTYNVKLNKMTEFLELIKSNLSNKSKYSTLLGYWKGDMGCSVSQVISLWVYTSLDERMKFENELSDDKEYQLKFINLIDDQNNLILREFEWAPFKNITSLESQENQVWELRTYHCKPGKFRQFPIDFQIGIKERKKYSEPQGIFYSEFGELNTIVHLWSYKNYEERFRIRGEVIKNSIWSNMVSTVVPYLNSMENKTLIPIKL